MRPATGKRFSMDYEEGEVTVCDQKVTAWKTRTCNGAGMMTILAQAHQQEAIQAGAWVRAPIGSGFRDPPGRQAERLFLSPNK